MSNNQKNGLLHLSSNTYQYHGTCGRIGQDSSSTDMSGVCCVNYMIRCVRTNQLLSVDLSVNTQCSFHVRENNNNNLLQLKRDTLYYFYGIVVVDMEFNMWYLCCYMTLSLVFYEAPQILASRIKAAPLGNDVINQEERNFILTTTRTGRQRWLWSL